MDGVLDLVENHLSNSIMSARGRMFSVRTADILKLVPWEEKRKRYMRAVAAVLESMCNMLVEMFGEEACMRIESRFVFRKDAVESIGVKCLVYASMSSRDRGPGASCLSSSSSRSSSP